MKHSILLSITAIFALQTLSISAIDSEKTGKAVVTLISEVVDSAQDLSETKQVVDKKERRRQRLAHVAKIIKAVTLAIIEIIAASKQGKIQFTRAGDAFKNGEALQEEVIAQLKLVLQETLDEIEQLEQEEATEQ